MKSIQSGGSPRCPMHDCEEDDDICHILTSHMSYSRETILNDIKQLCLTSISGLDFSSIIGNCEYLTQLILDPTSLNLAQRIHISDPCLPDLFKLCHKYCYYTDKERTQYLKETQLK